MNKKSKKVKNMKRSYDEILEAFKTKSVGEQKDFLFKVIEQFDEYRNNESIIKERDELLINLTYKINEGFSLDKDFVSKFSKKIETDLFLKLIRRFLYEKMEYIDGNVETNFNNELIEIFEGMKKNMPFKYKENLDIYKEVATYLIENSIRDEINYLDFTDKIFLQKLKNTIFEDHYTQVINDLFNKGTSMRNLFLNQFIEKNKEEILSTNDLEIYFKKEINKKFNENGVYIPTEKCVKFIVENKDDFIDLNFDFFDTLVNKNKKLAYDFMADDLLSISNVYLSNLKFKNEITKEDEEFSKIILENIYSKIDYGEINKNNFQIHKLLDKIRDYFVFSYYDVEESKKLREVFADYFKSIILLSLKDRKCITREDVYLQNFYAYVFDNKINEYTDETKKEILFNEEERKICLIDYLDKLKKYLNYNGFLQKLENQNINKITKNSKDLIDDFVKLTETKGNFIDLTDILKECYSDKNQNQENKKIYDEINNLLKKIVKISKAKTVIELEEDIEKNIQNKIVKNLLSSINNK